MCTSWLNFHSPTCELSRHAVLVCTKRILVVPFCRRLEWLALCVSWFEICKTEGVELVLAMVHSSHRGEAMLSHLLGWIEVSLCIRPFAIAPPLIGATLS